MKTQRTSKQEVVVWKLKFVPLVGGATKEKLAESKRGLENQKGDLKTELLKLEDLRDRADREIDYLMETQYQGTGTLREVVAEHHIGKGVVEARLEKIAKTEKDLKDIDGDILAVDKREKALVARRKEKELKLAKVKELNREIDEGMDKSFEGEGTFGHMPAVNKEARVEEWLNDNLPEEKREKYLLNKKLIGKYEAELKEPEVEEPPPPKRTMSEEEKQRAVWRKALAAFQPHKKFAERAREGPGAAVEKKYGEAVGKAEKKEYEEGIKLLKEAKELVDDARGALEEEKEKAALETKNAAAEQKEAFAFTTEVKDKEWGFDPDDDSPNFYLANSVNALGGLEASPQLKKMHQVYADCLERRDRMKKAGASIDEIVEAVYKNIPKNFWPDDVVREVQLYKAVKAEIEAEEALAQSVLDLDGAVEGAEEGAASVGEKVWDTWEIGMMADELNETVNTGMKWFDPSPDTGRKTPATEALHHFADTFFALTDSTAAHVKGASALKAQGELEEARAENPVKAKIVEFQRNKAIIDCVNSLASAGLDVAAKGAMEAVVPVLGAVAKSKDFLADLAGAITYFNNLRQVEKLQKGAAVDPHTAALLPLARQAREQKIAASAKVVSAVAKMLQAAGKVGEAAVVTAPVTVAIDVAGRVITYGGRIVIAGINWADAAKAVASIKLAAGPPPNRKAQFEVLKNSAKYARVALAQLAKDNDPWAIGHLENMGLGREDINNKTTSTKLLREYMTLRSGGLLADGIGEDQKTFGQTMPARAAKFIGRGVVKGAEKVRDLIVRRDTSIPYDPSWRRLDAAKVVLTADNWQIISGEAVAAGWYDSRPAIEADLHACEQTRGRHEANRKQKLEGEARKKAVDDANAAIAALGVIRDKIGAIKAVANDRQTPHAGMEAFLDGWRRNTERRAEHYRKDRSKWINDGMFPGKKGPDLAAAKQEYLEKAEKEAREKQVEKADQVRKKIDKLWEAHKIPGPYEPATIEDFTAAAKKKLRLDDAAEKALRTEVGGLRDAFHERLTQEVMAAPDEKELEDRFNLSVQTVDPIAVEALRAACEGVHKEMLGRTGAAEDDGWKPSGGDFDLTAAAWAKVEKAAKEKGWKGDATGLTPALKNYETALAGFLREKGGGAENRTKTEQAQGVLIGRIDELVTAMEDFQPLTDKQFNHPGLCAWRDGMIELAAAARVEHGAPLFEE